MKFTKLLASIALAMLLSTCQKDKSQTISDAPSVSLPEVTKVLNSAEGKFVEFGLSSGTTPQEALELTAGWLKSQSNISQATIVDNAYIDIRLKSGVLAVFFLDITDEDGISINRGGGSGESSVKLSEAFKSKNIIENKKVLLCYPNLQEFYKEDVVSKFVTHLQRSELGLEITKKEYHEVNPDLISSFGNYGLVIINTHGFKDCFLSGSRIDFDAHLDSTDLAVKNFVILKFGQKTYDDLTNGLLRLGFHARTSSGPDWVQKYTKTDKGFTIWIGSEYIRSLPDMPNTIIFGNFCYSGQTNPSKEYPNPIGAAFESKKLISYYGYHSGKGDAYQVDNAFAKAMEDSLTKALMFDSDSTGYSYLSYTGVEFKDPNFPGYLKHYGAMDYSYNNCVDVFTDKRDGIIYKAVCIGNQNWMAENLRFNAPGSLFYDNNPSNGPIYGKLYSWKMILNGQAASDKVPSGVRGICPEGWHVPSNAEWEILISNLGGKKVAGGAIKDIVGWDPPNNGATNSSGFTAKPGGYENGDGYFSSKGIKASWWTSTIDIYHSAYSYAPTIDNIYPSIAIYGSEPTIHMSCRCVKDK